MKIKILLTGIIILCQSCNAQTANDNGICNRKAADKSLAKKLPRGVCVPDNYTVDQIITGFDFNLDSKEDVAIRYSEFPLKNGVTRYYSIFQRVSDTVFIKKNQLQNILPPYVVNIYAGSSDSLVNTLIGKYPYDIKINFAKDSIKISHLIPEYYGKTYEFLYDKNKGDWYLQKIQYWIGDIDRRDIEQMDLSLKLLNKVPLESKDPKQKFSIREFNLIQSKKIADSEESKLLTNKYDVFEWSQKNK